MTEILAAAVFILLAAARVPWWAVAAAILGMLAVSLLTPYPAHLAALLVAVSVTAVFAVPVVRRAIVTGPLFSLARRLLPEFTAEELAVIESGAVGLEADLMEGRPDWPRYAAMQAKPDESEQAFLDGPVNEVCAMVDDWEVTHTNADLPDAVWEFLKVHKFFGMAIPREHGGHGFSAFAQSEVLARLNSHSMILGVTVAVPNSLGPGELIHRYGTPAQKEHYLPRLASGEEIPCFALTSPDAGSDASAILDEGIVVRREIDGEEQLGIELTFSKRYITLAPVATLVGLAFKLRDPDGLLGDTAELGITCALIPRETPGMSIGRRHYPLNVPFQNGPIEGDGVTVSLDQVIGGRDGIGQGWMMLVECLSAGRGISLPSGSAGSSLASTLNAGAYARIRHQFGIALADMEGIKASLASQVANTVTTDAMRRLVAQEVDAGRPSGVAAAIVKYSATERGRQAVNGAMDVHGGKGIMLGPNNYLGRSYQGLPIAITVEGANIMTRSLMIFGQGALRCHPFLLDEMHAIQADEIDAWHDHAARHVGWSIRNVCRSFTLALATSVNRLRPGDRRDYELELNRYSAALAVLTDLTIVTFGGAIKREQHLSARIADLLTELYAAASVHADAHYSYRSAGYEAVYDHAMESVLLNCDRALAALTFNWPNRPVGILLHWLLRPTGATHRGPHDDLVDAVSNLVTTPSTFRENLARATFHGEGSSVGALDDAMRAVEAVGPLVARLRKELGLPKQFRRFAEMGERARAAELVSESELALLQRADRARMYAISVDDFDPAVLRHEPAASQSGALDNAAL